MKVRTKKAATVAAVEPSASEQTRPFTWVDIDQPGMVVVRSVDAEIDKVDGAYVKVSPTIRASERASLDSKELRERLVAAGALAVVIAPIVVPDSTSDLKNPDRPDVRLKSPEAHLQEWFAGVKGSTLEQLEAALAEALASADEAGL